ncbi:aminotransferase class IV [Agaricicola taiwanensis]|uniref:aminotransferase class IV n=1 Tax=Agaricicola taiwanensis TaxID=591372 RepID=UPI001E45C609|nr:aminotransferase class IV [Agaricicola taiwanensis]
MPFNLSDRGLLLADGVFETLLVTGGRAFLLDEHLDRLTRGCATLGIACDRRVPEQAVRDLVAAAPGAATLRVTVTRGAGARGLPPPKDAVPTIFASRSPWSEGMAFSQVRLAVSSIRRNATSPLSRIKSLAYLDNVLALGEARQNGADDALILSSDGNVACASAANIFILENRHLTTPPTSVGILDGIMRGFTLSAARDMGLAVVEEAFGLDRLMKADAIFLTNSVRLLMPVIALDGKECHPAATDLMVKLASALADALGLHSRPTF